MTTTLIQGARVRINEEYLKGYQHIPPEDLNLLPRKTGTIQGPSTLPFFYRVAMDEPTKGLLYELYLETELEPF